MLTRRSGSRLPVVVFAAVSLAALAGCGGAAPSPTGTAAATATTEPTPTVGASPSASLSASPSLSPSPGLGLQHVNTDLEDLLPDTIGGVELQKLSVPMATYVASSKGGDKTLLVPWAVHFGKTPADIDMAIATDLSQLLSFFVQAIEVPGESASDLTGEFARLARQAGWPVTDRRVASRPVLEITDPAVEASGGLATAYILAVGDVMYVVVTDDPSLLVECLIKLPK